MKTRTGIALVFLVLALSLTTATLIQQNSQAPAWTLIPTTAALQQPTPKSITVTWGNEILANTNTTSNQMYSSVCCRSDGSFVVAWSSLDQDGDGYGVYVKIFNSTGGSITGDIQVNTYTTGDQWEPSVCCRSDGSFVVAWMSYGQDAAGGFGVYAKLFNSTGGNTTGDIQVNTYTTSYQMYPSVCCRSDGSFVVAWESYGQDAANSWGVYAKLFNSTGGNTTGDIQVNTYTTNFQMSPSVCCRSDGSFVVAWTSDGQDGSSWGVFAKLFNSTGGNTTGDIQVNTYIASDQQFPSVCCRSDGSFVVAWQSYGQDGEWWGVYAKLFNSAGGNTTDEIQVNTYTTSDQADPSVCCRSDGSFVVAW
nr:hypothetical protein [Candidatus Freyarchaeota archaeon]